MSWGLQIPTHILIFKFPLLLCIYVFKKPNPLDMLLGIQNNILMLFNMIWHFYQQGIFFLVMGKRHVSFTCSLVNKNANAFSTSQAYVGIKRINNTCENTTEMKDGS